MIVIVAGTVSVEPANRDAASPAALAAWQAGPPSATG